jgi:hypothetical protein
MMNCAPSPTARTMMDSSASARMPPLSMSRATLKKLSARRK